MAIIYTAIDLANIPLNHTFNKIFGLLDPRMTYKLEDPNWWITLSEAERGQILETIANEWQNNYKYEYEIYNETKDVYITPTHFSLEIFSENRLGKISPNKLDFSVEFFKGKYKGLDFATMVGNKDVLIFRAKIEALTFEIFKGTVKEFNKSFNNIKDTINVVAYDSTLIGYEQKAEKNILYVDKYYCNNTDTANSIMHQLAYKMGYTDPDLLFDNITDGVGGFLKVPFLFIEKGTFLSTEVSELARAVNAELFEDTDNLIRLMKVTDIPNNSSFTFDGNKIKEKLDTINKTAEYTGVKVVYDSYSIKPEQTIFKLISPTGTEDDASIMVPDGTTDANNNVWWGINYISEMATNINTAFVTKGYHYVNESRVNIDPLVENTHYIIEYDEGGGRIKFLNDAGLGHEIYIEKFEILGQPIFKYSGNEYTILKQGETEDTAKIMDTSNKYIQTQFVAQEHAEKCYVDKCLDSVSLRLKSNLVYFLDPLRVCDLSHHDYTGDVLLLGITHSPFGSSLTFKTKNDYVYNNESITERLSSMQEYTFNIARSEVKSLETRVEDLETRVTALETP